MTVMMMVVARRRGRDKAGRKGMVEAERRRKDNGQTMVAMTETIVGIIVSHKLAVRDKLSKEGKVPSMLISISLKPTIQIRIR
jgi:hypothetical protein